ncbi:transposase [Actinomadura verrucosospora]|uniref:transposase n=1 Tax=Actinomadura verrucosospora TaxID=46165 RepID=UPI003D188F62
MPGHNARANYASEQTQASHRQFANAFLYVVRWGCRWRYLPVALPPRKSVYWYFPAAGTGSVTETLPTQYLPPVGGREDSGLAERLPPPGPRLRERAPTVSDGGHPPDRHHRHGPPPLPRRPLLNEQPR